MMKGRKAGSSNNDIVMFWYVASAVAQENVCGSMSWVLFSNNHSALWQKAETSVCSSAHISLYNVSLIPHLIQKETLLFHLLSREEREKMSLILLCVWRWHGRHGVAGSLSNAFKRRARHVQWAIVFV